MLLVGIDLASRHSAAVVVDDSGTTILETTFDAGPNEKPPNPFTKALALAQWWVPFHEALGESEVYFVFEDIPPFGMIDPKAILRFQGGLVMLMVLHGIECHIINASVWQNEFGYTKKEFKNSKTWAKAYAEENLGYTPGLTLPEGTKTLAKQREDLIDARLLAEWLRRQILGEDLTSDR